MKVQRIYKHKQSAKRALKKVFGIGPYSSCGRYANAKFISGGIERDGDAWTVRLYSTYWSEGSLEKAFRVGIDNI